MVASGVDGLEIWTVGGFPENLLGRKEGLNWEGGRDGVASSGHCMELSWGGDHS